jgi:hypothetical protein
MKFVDPRPSTDQNRTLPGALSARHFDFWWGDLFTMSEKLDFFDFANSSAISL